MFKPDAAVALATALRSKDEEIERLLMMVTLVKRENLDIAEKLAAAERRIAQMTGPITKFEATGEWSMPTERITFVVRDGHRILVTKTMDELLAERDSADKSK